MATIKEDQWNSVIKYIQEKLLTKKWEYKNGEGDIKAAVNEDDINILQEIAPYSDYLVSTVNSSKKKVVKKPVGDQYVEEWSIFWNTWPNTKSVPNTEYKSGAKMKADEPKMYKKWLSHVYSESTDNYEHMIAKIQRAAEVYLQWAYYESINKGKNELQYRNGMEPWLNQAQYKLYADVPYPPVIENKQVTDYSINI